MIQLDSIEEESATHDHDLLQIESLNLIEESRESSYRIEIKILRNQIKELNKQISSQRNLIQHISNKMTSLCTENEESHLHRKLDLEIKCLKGCLEQKEQEMNQRVETEKVLSEEVFCLQHKLMKSERENKSLVQELAQKVDMVDKKEKNCLQKNKEIADLRLKLKEAVTNYDVMNRESEKKCCTLKEINAEMEATMVLLDIIKEENMLLRRENGALKEMETNQETWQRKESELDENLVHINNARDCFHRLANETELKSKEIDRENALQLEKLRKEMEDMQKSVHLFKEQSLTKLYNAEAIDNGLSDVTQLLHDLIPMYNEKIVDLLNGEKLHELQENQSKLTEHLNHLYDVMESVLFVQDVELVNGTSDKIDISCQTVDSPVDVIATNQNLVARIVSLEKEISDCKNNEENTLFEQENQIIRLSWKVNEQAATIDRLKKHAVLPKEDKSTQSAAETSTLPHTLKQLSIESLQILCQRQYELIRKLMKKLRRLTRNDAQENQDMMQDMREKFDTQLALNVQLDEELQAQLKIVALLKSEIVDLRSN
ncbi:hypothetical protein Ciccas_004084 [Cichlidogyrus casuarinus]|uniref:Uncharacterized protein n=1 Tax=Cichlidogyrus casuarinus TaxID=1844966 RepID=A0ABD2QCJ7_9PLAT